MIYWIKKYFTDYDAHSAAIIEVLITAIFSLIPFAVTYFTETARRPDGSLAGIDNIFGRGQLYLLSYGIFGTIFWLAFIKADKPRHGARVFLGLTATLITLPVIGFIGVDPTFSTVHNKNIVTIGYWVYAVMLCINYLLLFYINISPPQPKEIFEREAGVMRTRYEEHKRHG